MGKLYRVSRRSDVIGRQYEKNLPFEEQKMLYDVDLERAEDYYYNTKNNRYGVNSFNISEIPRFKK